MPRHLPEDEVRSALLRGATVEQFIERHLIEGRNRVAWLEIRPQSEFYAVRRFDVEDLGNADSADVYAWMEGDTESQASFFSTPEDAVQFAMSNYGASRQRWVNEGLVQDEYLDAIVSVSGDET